MAFTLEMVLTGKTRLIIVQSSWLWYESKISGATNHFKLDQTMDENRLRWRREKSLEYFQLIQ